MLNALTTKLNKERKKLILLTSKFPYGKGETFLENEFPFLLNGFEEIIIFSESNKGESRIKYTRVEIKLLLSINWKSRIKAFFNQEFYRELNSLKKLGKFNLSTFRTAWYSLSKSTCIAKQLESLENNESSVFYSYWLDEKALALALLKRKNPSFNVISRAHGWDVYEERHPNNYLPYRNLLTENLDAIYTISENGKAYLLDRYQILTEKIQMSRLGTLPLVAIPEKLKSDSFHILSISSIIPLKRVEKILEVVSCIPTIKIKWTHIGTGSEFEKIKDIAIQKSQQNPNFSFELKGQMTNTEVRGLLATNYFDLFLNLSETEGIPVSIMEAQSAGIPVLATNVGGTSEIANNENGFLVEKDFNQEEVVSIIQKYLSSTNEEKQRKRNASYENWKQSYNAETNYNQFVELLKTCTKPSRSANL
jgi:colanic acid/amylovoran biosynthesis glycosyltransferase